MVVSYVFSPFLFNILSLSDLFLPVLLLSLKLKVAEFLSDGAILLFRQNESSWERCTTKPV